MVYGVEHGRAVAVAAKDLGILLDIFIVDKGQDLVPDLAAREKDHFDLGIGDHCVEVLGAFLYAPRVYVGC